MKQFLGIVSLMGIAAISLQASPEKMCPRCEEIREYNKTHHKNYEYYEDYLNDQNTEEKTEQPAANAKKTSSNSDATQPKLL